MRQIALVIAPFRNASEDEQQATRTAVELLIFWGYVPVFLPWALERVLSDHNEVERSVALQCSQDFTAQIAKAGGAAFVVMGRISEGMKADIEAWKAAGGSPPEEI